MQQHTIENLFELLRQQISATRICFKANLFSHYLPQNRDEIFQFITRQLVTLDQERICGYGAVLMQILKQYGDAASLQKQMLETIQPLLQLKFGTEKMLRLSCILTCFKAAVMAGQPALQCEALLQQLLVSKIGPLNPLASMIVYQTLVGVEGDFSTVAEKCLGSYFGVFYLLQQNRKVQPEQLYQGLLQACAFADRPFVAKLVENLNKFGQTAAVLGYVQQQENLNQFAVFLSQLNNLADKTAVQQFYTAVIPQHLPELVVELQTRAPLHEDFNKFLCDALANEAVCHAVTDSVMKLKTADFFTSKPFNALTSGMTEDEASAVLKHVLELSVTDPLPLLHPIVTLSRSISLTDVMALLQSIFRKLGVPLQLVESNAFNVTVPIAARDNFAKIALQIIFVQNEAQAIVYTIAEQMSECGRTAHCELLKHILAKLKEIKVNKQDEQSKDAALILQNLKEMTSQMVLISFVQPELQQFCGYLQELSTVIDAIVISANNDVPAADQFRTLYQILGRMITRLSRFEGPVLTNFLAKTVRNFAEICYDELFDELVAGLDLGNNLNEESSSEQESDEQDVPEENEEKTETDLFSYNRERISSEEHLFEQEEIEENEEIEEVEKEIEPDKQTDEDEYDRVLAAAVREIITARTRHLLKPNLNVAIKSAQLIEILLKSNIGRPITWEIVLALIHCAENPMKNVVLNKDNGEKLNIKDREQTEILQNRCVQIVLDKDLYTELDGADMFEDGEFILADDIKELIELLQQGRTEIRAACGFILLNILQKLNGNVLQQHYLDILTVLCIQGKMVASFAQLLAKEFNIATKLASSVLSQPDVSKSVEKLEETIKNCKPDENLKHELIKIIFHATKIEGKSSFRIIRTVGDIIKTHGIEYKDELKSIIQSLHGEVKNAVQNISRK